MVARKTSTAPTRIWKFPARVSDPDMVNEALFAARRYYNSLVEIERGRHTRFISIRRQFAPELAALDDEWMRIDDEITSLYRDVRRSRQAHWQETGGEKRRILDDEARAREAELKEIQKRISTSAKAHRAAFNALLTPAREEFVRRARERTGDGGPRIKSAANAAVLAEMLDEPMWSSAWKEIARSDDSAHAELLRARAECGLATGTYLQIEEAFARAKKDSSPRPPRFKRFDRTGKLAVQVRDATYADLCAGTNAVRVSPAPDNGQKRGRKAPVVVEMDQSVPHGERRKIRFTAIMHRVPPHDVVVKWASLLVRRTGDRLTYEFQLTIEHPSFAEPKRPAGARDPEHVRIGWSSVDGGVRVASYPGGEVIVPDAILDASAYAASVESVADRYFNLAKHFLRRWMRHGPHRLTAWHLMRSDRVRSMLRRACKDFADWALDGHAHDAWKEWRADRLARGEDLYARPALVRRWLRARGRLAQTQQVAFWCYVWARKDEHLCQLAADLKRRATNRRDAFFRAAAIRVATEFASVTVDKYKISDLKQLPELTRPGDAPVFPNPHHTAQAAGPGRFREILVEVMGSRCTPCERPSGGGSARGARRRKIVVSCDDTMSVSDIGAVK